MFRVNNNNRKDDVTEDGVKKEDGEIIDNVSHRYIGDDYENMINNIVMYGLKDRFLKCNFKI